MLTEWLSKVLLAFMLTFAWAGGAFGQSKSADLPVPQRIICAPIKIAPIDSPESQQDQIAQSLVDVFQASRTEMHYAALCDIFSAQLFGGDTRIATPAISELIWIKLEPWGGLLTLFR